MLRVPDKQRTCSLTPADAADNDCNESIRRNSLTICSVQRLTFRPKCICLLKYDTEPQFTGICYLQCLQISLYCYFICSYYSSIHRRVISYLLCLVVLQYISSSTDSKTELMSCFYRNLVNNFNSNSS